MEIQLTMDANAREQVSLKNEFNNSHKRSSTIPVNKQLILLSKTFGKFDKIVRDVSPLVYRETRVTTTRQPKIEASSIFLNSGSSVLRPLDDMPNFFH